MAEVIPLPLLIILIGVASAALTVSINKAFKRIDSAILEAELLTVLKEHA